MRWVVVVVSGSNSTIRVTADLRGKTFGITKPEGGSYINTMLSTLHVPLRT
jgi:ABC-type nitrate/sulfonate/bicarbonate transport system substrate-binding protein